MPNAFGLLDENGFLTEIRIQSAGFGYKKNLAKDRDVRCIIDSFTILKTGSGYTSPPDLYVNGQLGVAEAIIDVDNGFVIGARVLNRQITFEEALKFEKIHKAIKQINQKLIKEITLFDVYDGENLPKNKKSYGISFRIQDDEKTLSDKDIEYIMNKVVEKLKKEFSAEIR